MRSMRVNEASHEVHEASHEVHGASLASHEVHGASLASLKVPSLASLKVPSLARLVLDSSWPDSSWTRLGQTGNNTRLLSMVWTSMASIDQYGPVWPVMTSLTKLIKGQTYELVIVNDSICRTGTGTVRVRAPATPVPVRYGAHHVPLGCRPLRTIMASGH